MLKDALNNFQTFLLLIKGKGHKRSVEASRSVLISFALKGLAVIVNLMYVPICIDYLDAERYGIWLTLSSIIGWMSFFDLGLGNGLRNKLTESLARDDIMKARQYVSTSYFLFSVIFISLIAVFTIADPFLNWLQILNIKNDTISNYEIQICALIVFIFFSLRFIFMNIAIVAYSKQKPFYSHLFSSGGSLLSLILIYILKYFTGEGNGDLTLLVFVLSSSQVFILIIASLILYNKSVNFKSLKPKIKLIELKLSKDILKLGLNFFVIQIVGLILFSSANILIARKFSTEEVTVYNIVFKYFNVVPMIYAIILSPIWSAVTDAIHRDDFIWLKKTLKGLNYISAVFIIGIIIMIFLSDFFYKLWIGDRIEKIQFEYSLIMGIWAITTVAFSPYSAYLNGFGKLKFSVRFFLLLPVFFIILAITLMDTFLKASGVMAATIIVNGTYYFFLIYQVKLLLNKNAYGIWNK